MSKNPTILKYIVAPNLWLCTDPSRRLYVGGDGGGGGGEREEDERLNKKVR
jgi:hypothetical protein